MNRFSLFGLSLLFVFFIGGCDDQSAITAPDTESTDSYRSLVTDVEPAGHGPIMAKGNGGGKKVVRHISAGGNDACEAVGAEPGCDANYSLTATIDASGNVKGRFTDTYGVAGTGVKGTIDCAVIVGNYAVVGGVVTNGSSTSGFDFTGFRFMAKVVDNGTSSKDTPDQISPSYVRSYFVDANDCTNYANAGFRLNDLTRGQVTIK